MSSLLHLMGLTIMQDFSQSFPPILGDHPKVLILGTLPSKESLRKQQYYGHPRNSFWKIIYTLFNGNFSIDYSERIKFAKNCNIAVWDVCYSAFRVGSLDSEIKKERPNTIDLLLNKNSSIRLVAFNGQKAALLYDKYFDRIEGIAYVTLLSTSPANAAFSFEKKLENWKFIKEIINY